MAANLVRPAFWKRSKAPSHRLRSGETGFLMNRVTSTPRKASASCCTEKGLTTVRAPIQRASTSYLKASSTCSGVATSVAMSKPVSFLAPRSHLSPSSPLPSKASGRVRGFHTPPRRNLTSEIEDKALAVAMICSSLSTLQGPAIIIESFMVANIRHFSNRLWDFFRYFAHYYHRNKKNNLS